jgi:hypothetical protein
MADPSIRGKGLNGTTGTANLVVTVDVAPVAGDHIYILVNVNNAVSGSHPIPASTGFSSLGTSTASVWSRLTLLGKIATGAEGTSFTISGFAGADSKYADVVVIQDAGASLATNIVNTPDATSNTTVSIPAITTAAAGSLDVVGVGLGGNNSGSSTNFTAWAAHTEQLDGSVSSGGGFYAGVGVATATRASAGVQAATTATQGFSDVNAVIRFEVAPAAGGATSILRQMMMGHG